MTKFGQARLSPSLIGQIIIEVSIEGTESICARCMRSISRDEKHLLIGANKIPGCYMAIPMGAFYTVTKLSVNDAEKFCA